jgi:hypothetical protein
MKQAEPKVPFREGLKRTIDWYYKDRDRAQVEAIFKRSCTIKLEVAVKREGGPTFRSDNRRRLRAFRP